MVVVALGGCTAAGKSTLVLELQRAAAVRVVSCDDFFLPRERCPRFDLQALPWPGEEVPGAFLLRGDADWNVPAAIDWSGVADAVVSAKQAAQSVVVDGMFVLADHPGARTVLQMCDHAAVLWADEHAATELCSRKYTRKHLGRSSYEERGVSAEEYRVYWENYVWPAWLQHGASSLPADCLRIGCTEEPAAQLDQLLGTGWFSHLTGDAR
ncbi:hypothetical protein EMIHUDRAFT_119278 [Emiliania huxleyi CCMP1516]|uniref:Phosphoribulokinase/uridine kinase domain-containing protein n=4 Tax=Emiliania huxleyi TaxID=2903 RepID=A0A0D3IWY2_EMIH1|nr:hypothetical protein EMIHUDRAFT_119278 [Emiliania huxleyi CCMP1516]EOD15767.1 hypothetical protein EMIHUDRAFT_119278 [Emiliania huxleyi CCMP1516]|eukprot:XP_005768196.1 hypothetical protein EMIHUDRAFT_119278 [Emiliania huxleyi CCMP1516]